ncbi:hypothetical protein LTR84_001051 [Exophiala bonariae]|uniref:Uncharacterized protein n=1 Tax=Exophiala bonariae TaxID=1690606 RepID=A0AAV9NSE2_9EURO|nr:hypothetical protein LTR84_001051 [Exophiala bonariae]
MSGAARRRGVGRAGGGNEGSSESSSRRGTGRQFPGGFDGPASRGSASNTGSGAGHASTPSVGSGRGSPNVSSTGPLSPPNQSNQPAPFLVDPALENPRRPTDAVRNVDLPASSYAVDNLVSTISSLQQSSIPFSALPQS